MSLKPPIPPPAKPVRCHFMFKANYQCTEMAEWCTPSMTDGWSFKWIFYCDIHKKDLLEQFPNLPDYWQKL